MPNKLQNLLFINCTAETFTPTKSGAICTWIWEVCRAAQRDNLTPWILSRDTDAPPYDWPNTILIPYPAVPRMKGAGRLYDLHKRLTGWGHIRQNVYAKRVAAAIRQHKLQDVPMFLQNDPEMVVFLRNEFPRARILHHAQNNNTCGERTRRAFGKAVNVASAVTDFCAAWNAEYFHAPVKTLYSGVDTDRFAPAAQPDRPPVINFVGRTDPPKGPDLLLKAALKVSQKTTRFSVQILGRNFYDRFEMDAFQKQIVDLAGELEKTGVTVRRPGWVTRHDLPSELQKADIHCVPARWDEPFGLTTLEGMSCGLATVASRTGGTPEVVADKGFLFERENADDLADRLADLITNPSLRRDYAQKARARAEELTWDRTWSQLSQMAGAIQ